MPYACFGRAPPFTPSAAFEPDTDWRGVLPLLQGTGAWPFPMAKCSGWVSAADVYAAGDVVGGHRLATAKLGRATGPGWVIYIGLYALFIWRYPLQDGIQRHVEYRAFSPQ